MLMGQGLGQHAKTHAARRVVPIHPVLIAAGFLDLVQQRRVFGIVAAVTTNALSHHLA